MSRRFGTKPVLRLLVILFLAGGFAAPLARQATAQEEPLTAAIVSGDCGAAGEVVADLRPLNVDEGGVLTSFSTIDLSIEELTTGGYAVIAGDPDVPMVCGDLTGEGTDIYVAVRAQNDAGLGGVVWLHARGDRTQVSIFVGEGLGGAPSTEPTEEPNSPPEPPVDETPEPTEVPSGDLATYESPNYGYTVAYDTALWKVGDEQTLPDDSGPTDYLALIDEGETVQAEFVGLSQLNPPLPATEYISNFVNGTQNNSEYQNVVVRTDDDGNPIRGGDDSNAYVAIDFTFTSEDGREIDNTYFVEAWQVPATEAFLIMIFQTSQRSYEAWVDEREALEDGIRLPE